MKKLLLVSLLLVVTVSLYSAEPTVKFHLSDGTFKFYNLNEIDNLQFPNAPDTLQIQVFTKDSTYYYPAQLIDSVKFAIDDKNEDRIHLWHDGFKWDFGVHEIDSILIYYTKHIAVTIGTQHWMYRNLDVDHYRNGDSIPEVREPGALPYNQKDSLTWRYRDEGAWCYLNNDPILGKIYGKLYNWYSVIDLRGLAPVGWHEPTILEWECLLKYLGGGQIAGNKAKEAGYEHWCKLDNLSTNECGFTGLPAGVRNNFGAFDGLGEKTNFWSNTAYPAPFCSYMYCYYSHFGYYDEFKESGFSVRCIKDK